MKLSFLLLLVALFVSQADAFMCEHGYPNRANCSQRSFGTKYTNNTTSDKVVQITAVGKNSTPNVSIIVDGQSYGPEIAPMVTYEYHATGAIATVPPGSTYSINASGALEFWIWGEN